MRSMLGFPISMYLRDVIGKIILPSILALIIPFLLCRYLEPTIARLLIVFGISVLWAVPCIVLFGLTTGERGVLFAKVKSVKNKIF